MHTIRGLTVQMSITTHRWWEGLPGRKKSSSTLGAFKWINQVLIIKKTSNENVLTEEKWKVVSNKKVSLIK